jgi:hypothetical protein
MLTEIHSYWLIKCNLSLTYPTQFDQKLGTWFAIFLKKLPSGLFFIYYKCIKDPLSNAAKEGSMKP